MPKPKYLIDANLPYYFSLWEGEEFIHQTDLGDTWSDEKYELMQKNIILQ